MRQTFVPDFAPSRHGFPFPNTYPAGAPVVELPTPFGVIPLGDASGGLCGGMAFAALDLFTFHQPPPPAPEPPVFRYLCRRLVDSFNLPGGVLKYFDWQRRPLETRGIAGVAFQDGLSKLTIEEEWPKIRELLDAEQLAPLGLVKAHSFKPSDLGKNHQVLAYGYSLDEPTGDLSIWTYDPNYPGDDDLAITINLRDPDNGHDIAHSREGVSIRGIFLTEYRAPTEPPRFE